MLDKFEGQILNVYGNVPVCITELKLCSQKTSDCQARSGKANEELDRARFLSMFYPK